MARIRTIKPEFWADEDIGELSTNARLLFISTWNLADDEGLLKWSASYLKAQVFAYDDITTSDVESMMDELTSGCFVHPYKGPKNKVYGWIVNFRKHQKIDRPQAPKHPLPSIQNRDIKNRYAERDGWVCHICNEGIPEVTDERTLTLSLDHVKPRSKGGDDCPSNIKVAHCGCNSSKRDKYEESEQQPLDDHSSNNREPSSLEGKVSGKGKEQGKEHDNNCAEPKVSTPEPPAVITIPTNRFKSAGEEYPVTQDQVDDWQQAYPAVDVIQTLREIRAWNMSNDTKRKTKTGVAKHINAWLAKEQNKGGHRVNGFASTASENRKPPSILEKLRLQDEQTARERAAEAQRHG